MSFHERRKLQTLFTADAFSPQNWFLATEEIVHENLYEAICNDAVGDGICLRLILVLCFLGDFWQTQNLHAR